MESKKLSGLANKIRKNIRKLEKIEVDENQGTITIVTENMAITLEPQLEDDGSLIYTLIKILYYYAENSMINKITLYFSSNVIEFEDDERKLTCKWKEVFEDPIELVNEEELFSFINKLERITTYSDFIVFCEEQFKYYSGLV